MRLSRVLRAYAICLLVPAFYGQHVSCGLFKSTEKSKKPSTVGASDVTENLKETVPSSYSELVYKNSEWNDSMLASTVLFIEEFCKDVKAEKFNGKISSKSYDGLSWACLYVSYNLEDFVEFLMPTHGPGSLDERNKIPRNLYENNLKPEELEVYVEWLKKNIPEIKKSYNAMFLTCVKLTKEEHKTEAAAELSKYGFVFVGASWTAILPRWSSMNTRAPTFVGSLEYLQQRLKKL
ncbi:hypothetical protein X943_000032 [Babesia divergens]|uniref:Uncharacterized protein n=1 Tax=Babesia divergens TaxID=32595 RepID=A0AAD9G6A0_BABDI|nr:hypothetical protein X943_000032 [Babesia divergens]